MNFSESQQIAFNSFLNKENVMLSGAGGTGKTTLIKYIYKYCNENNKKIQVCALTGCASLLLDCKATTIHSWANVGIYLNGSIENIVKNILKKNLKEKDPLKNRINDLEVFIVDEVSMLSKKLFDVLELLFRKLKNNNKIFGGIQLIFSGDFFQLPPIGNDEDTSAFCFESNKWNETFSKQIELKTIFRQKDSKFIKVLNQVRLGHISKKTFDLLQNCVGKDSKSMKIKPTRLYPLRKMVDTINENELKNINEESNIYKLQLINEKNNASEKEVESFVNQVPCNTNLVLKIGAQVMSIINMNLEEDLPICNGSCGIVIDFNKNKNPIVRFSNNRIMTINPHTWTSYDNKIRIIQIPLILSWALTIHKCQGATLDMAEINIGSSIFEDGQSYVALSRLKSFDGLYLTDLDPWKIKANKKAIKYYEFLKEKELKEKELEKLYYETETRYDKDWYLRAELNNY